MLVPLHTVPGGRARGEVYVPGGRARDEVYVPGGRARVEVYTLYLDKVSLVVHAVDIKTYR